MGVHIDQLTSDVIPETETAPESSGGESGEAWEEVDRVRQAASRLKRDGRRTCAEGFDD